MKTFFSTFLVLFGISAFAAVGEKTNIPVIPALVETVDAGKILPVIPEDAMMPLSKALFTDVTKSYPFFTDIKFLKESGIINGFPDGSFQPNTKITRYEFTKIIVGALYSAMKIRSCDQKKYAFPDMPAGEWFSPYVCLAKKEGILGGYSDGTFGGNNGITFPEAMKIVLNGYNVEVTPTKGEWYEKYIATADNINLASPWLSRKIDHALTRGEMAFIVTFLEMRSRANQ